MFKLRTNFTTLAVQRVNEALRERFSPDYLDVKQVLIGIHIRRTDYVGILKSLHGTDWVGREYFLRAMEYFRHKYNDPTVGTKAFFLATGDDMTWVRTNLGKIDDVVPVGTEGDQEFTKNHDSAGSIGTDLATLALCDHIILSHGTFGVWAGLLAGGEVVMPDEFGALDSLQDVPEELDDMKKADLPGWKFLSTQTWKMTGRDLEAS